jgi:hypothetical protein
VDLQVNTSDLEKYTASIFGPEDKGDMFLQNFGVYLQIPHHLKTHKLLPTTSELKMETVCYQRFREAYCLHI